MNLREITVLTPATYATGCAPESAGRTVQRTPTPTLSDFGESTTSNFPEPADKLAPIQIPSASSFFTTARLACTLVQAIPMVASIKYFARSSPGLSPQAPESAAYMARQTDVLARQAAVTVTCANMDDADLNDIKPILCRSLPDPNNHHWLAGGFQLVLGAGFFGMYQHAGVMRALCNTGLHKQINELCGVSSGAITAALYGCQGPQEMTKTLLTLSLLDFLDLSLTKLVYEGALCAGKAVEQKLAAETGRFGCTRLEDVPGPKLRVATFDGRAGKTVWHTHGPLAPTVAQSAALPVLFANQGCFDGGWVDHHGFTALSPARRALSVRINTSVEPDAMAQLVGRPKPLFNISTDPEHQTVALDPKHKITPKTFLFDIDCNKKKLAGIINESESMFTYWLSQPCRQPTT